MGVSGAGGVAQTPLASLAPRLYKECVELPKAGSNGLITLLHAIKL